MTTIRHIEVVGNDGRSKRKEAAAALKRLVPSAAVIDVTYWGRAESGAPVFAVEYEEGT